MKAWKLGVVMMVSCLLAVGCSDSDSNDKTNLPVDNGGNDQGGDKTDGVKTPSIASMNLTTGKKGTLLTISGSNLDEVSQVCFGPHCVEPESKSSDTVTAKVPEGSGMVLVTVKVGDVTLKPGTFTYLEESANDAEIDWCQVTWVEPTIKSGEAIQAYAQVYESGKTGLSSTHEGIQAQVGYASVLETDVAKFQWVAAERNAQFNDAAAENNDEYMASSELKVADGSYQVAFRFSLDGVNWKMCDLNGSSDGFDLSQTGRVVVAAAHEAVKTVGWCRIVNGKTSSTSSVNEESTGIYAQAFVEDCTDYQNHCADLKAQIGYGLPSLTDTAAIAANFTWKDATLNLEYDGSGGQKHDEYYATLQTDVADQYAVVYRFSVDDGETWTYCDTTDDNAFSSIDAYQWNVGVPETQGTTVDWCRVQSPSSVTVRANHETSVIYGQAYVKNCTGYPYTQCGDLKAQLGYGDPNDTDASGFTFIDAALNESAYPPSNNNEYGVSLTPTQAGEYALVYRFSMDGEKWTYCDFDDEVGFDMTKAVKMTVNADEDSIDWCRVQYPASQTVRSGETTQPWYGQIYSAGCTDGAQKCESITAELGYGPKGSDVENFIFVKAEYNEALTTTNNDEYFASLTVDEVGGYDVVYRFSTNDGQSWTYCDFNDVAGFDLNQAASLTVEDDTLKVDWCQAFLTDSVTSMTLESGQESSPIYGQAFVSGCTEANGACENLKAYVAYGTADQNLEDFVKKEATFDMQVGNNDQFKSTIAIENHDAQDVVYDLVYGFQLGSGDIQWCSLANSSEFNRADAAKVTVRSDNASPVQKKIDWCHISIDGGNTSTVLSSGDSLAVYGQVFVDGCTQGDGACENLKGFAAYGAQDDALDKFTRVDAQYFGTSGDNNDEFKATLQIENSREVVENYDLVFGFSLDDGKTVTWCDAQDSQDFNRDNAIRLSVKPKTEILSWGNGNGDYQCGIENQIDNKNNAYQTGKTTDSFDIYGSIYIPGCTNSESCKFVKSASLLYYKGKPTNDNYGNKSWVSVTAESVSNKNNHNNINYKATAKFTAEDDYYFYYVFGLEDETSKKSQPVQCWVNWKSPYEATLDDLGKISVTSQEVQ